MTQEQRNRLQLWLPLIVLTVLVLAVGLYDHTFFSVSNFLSVTGDTMTLFLMAAGVTMVIMMGGIDLSVQATASMASCILAAYLPRYGIFAVPLAVLGGVAAGFAGGFVSTRLRIPSFIATLAVSGVVLSAGYWFSETRSINIPADLRNSYLGWAVVTTGRLAPPSRASRSKRSSKVPIRPERSAPRLARSSRSIRSTSDPYGTMRTGSRSSAAR